jgi:hypothetical protein
MRVNLSIRCKGLILYEAVNEISDAESFGRAFADLWSQLQNRRLQEATSIGALMEELNEDVLGELNATEIALEKVPTR